MRRKRSSTHTASGSPRPSRRIAEAGADKLSDVTACPTCSASYREGRWTWEPAPADSRQKVCPACERIAQGYPAGVLHVGGGFVAAHREELVGLVRHVEERERGNHPLKRIMSIEDEGPGFVVQTTDAKLAAALGRALEKAYSGRLEHPPTSAEPGNLVRVSWSRD